MKTGIKIFVSSTFKDLQREREMLVKGVFPKAKAYALEKGLSLYFVDLRWGITSYDNLEIIKSCLDEIDNCTPYFIGVIGNRYGYVPEDITGLDLDNIEQYKNKSITEMEITYGVFNKVERNKSIFAIKKSCDYNELIALNKPDTLDVENQINKLNNLKANVYEYCQENKIPCYKDYEDLDDFGDFFYNKLIELIDAEVKEIGDITEFKQQNYLNNNLVGVIKNNHMFKYIERAIYSDMNKIVICGDSYIGKTTLLNHYFNQFDNKIIINLATDGTLHNINNLYKYLAKKLNIEFTNINDVNEYLKNYKGNQLYIVINDINLIDDENNATLCLSFPKEVSKDIVIAVSTNNNSQARNLFLYDYKMIVYKDFDSFTFAEDYFKQECQRYGKNLSDELLKQFRTCEFCRSLGAAKAVLNMYLHEDSIEFYPFLNQCKTLLDFYFSLVECTNSKEKRLSYIILLLLHIIKIPMDLDLLYEMLEYIDSQDLLKLNLNKYEFNKAINEIHTFISYDEGKIELLNSHVKNAIKRSYEKNAIDTYNYLESNVDAFFCRSFTTVMVENGKLSFQESKTYFYHYCNFMLKNNTFEEALNQIVSRGVLRYFINSGYSFWESTLIKLYNHTMKVNNGKVEHKEMLHNFAAKNMLSNEEMIFLYNTLINISQLAEADKLAYNFGLYKHLQTKGIKKANSDFDMLLNGSDLEINERYLEDIDSALSVVDDFHKKTITEKALLFYFYLENKEKVEYYFNIYKSCCDMPTSILMLFEGYLTTDDDKELAYIDLAIDLAERENNLEIMFLAVMYYHKIKVTHNDLTVTEFYISMSNYLFKNQALLINSSHVAYKYYQFIFTYCSKHFNELEDKQEFLDMINSILNKNYQKIVKIQAMIAQAKLNNNLQNIHSQLQSFNPDIYKHLISTMLNEITDDNISYEEENHNDFFIDNKIEYLYELLKSTLNKTEESFKWKKLNNEPLEIEFEETTLNIDNYCKFKCYILNDKLFMTGEYRIRLPEEIKNNQLFMFLLNSLLTKGDGFNSLIKDGILAIGYSIKYTPDGLRIPANGPTYIMSFISIARFYLELINILREYNNVTEEEFGVIWEKANIQNNNFMTKTFNNNH